MEDLEALRARFNHLWTLMRVDETLWPHRYAATFGLWRQRSPAVQRAMETKAEKGIGKRNPYFWVQDFADVQPEFLKGNEKGDLVQVRYNGAYKICTRQTMVDFNLEFVKNW